MKVNVPDMSCKHCEAKIKKALLETGVKSVDVNLKTKDVTIDLGNVSLDSAVNAIKKAGYTVK